MNVVKVTISVILPYRMVRYMRENSVKGQPAGSTLDPTGNN